jgi:hypothetical protein
MSTPEGSLNQARYLVSQLDFPGAQQVLRGFLAQSPQDPSFATEESADGAVLYAGVLLHLSDPHNARTWGTYAHAVMRRIHGERDSRTLHTLGVLAVTEHRAGALDQSTRHYQQLITALSAAEGPDGDRALAARADAAIVEHARGLCDNARNALGQVISAHQARYGPTHPLGIRMLVRLAAMWRDCRNPKQAHLILAQARAQASSLPPEDETHQVLSAAARATADSSHHCGVATISPGTQAGVFPVLLVPDPQDFIAPPRPGMPPRIEDEWPEDEILDAPLARPVPSYMPPPAAPPPPVMVMTRPIAVPPPVVRLKKAPKPKRRKPWLIPTVIGLVALVAGGLVTAAILTSGQANSPQSLASSTPSPSASAAPLAEPSGPVSNLRLQDQGDKLLITWIYPANAKGPIVISAAKAGEPMRALQSLPAGTESMVLPGLDPAGNYCVTVTVAYQSDHLVMSPAVCTDRKR